MSKYDNMCRCPWPEAGKYEPWGYKCVLCARTVCIECIEKGPSPMPGVYNRDPGDRGELCVCCRRIVPKEVKKRPSEDEQWWEAQVNKHRRRVSVLESQNKRMRDGYKTIFEALSHEYSVFTVPNYRSINVLPGSFNASGAFGGNVNAFGGNVNAFGGNVNAFGGVSRNFNAAGQNFSTDLKPQTRRLAQAWMNTIPDTTTTEQESQT
jgi:hypothetical protein